MNFKDGGIDMWWQRLQGLGLGRLLSEARVQRLHLVRDKVEWLDIAKARIPKAKHKLWMTVSEARLLDATIRRTLLILKEATLEWLDLTYFLQVQCYWT